MSTQDRWEGFIESILIAHGITEEEAEAIAQRHSHRPLEPESDEVVEEVTVNGGVIARLWMKKSYWMEAIANEAG